MNKFFIFVFMGILSCPLQAWEITTDGSLEKQLAHSKLIHCYCEGSGNGWPVNLKEVVGSTYQNITQRCLKTPNFSPAYTFSFYEKAYLYSCSAL